MALSTEALTPDQQEDLQELFGERYTRIAPTDPLQANRKQRRDLFKAQTKRPRRRRRKTRR